MFVKLTKLSWPEPLLLLARDGFYTKLLRQLARLGMPNENAASATVPLKARVPHPSRDVCSKSNLPNHLPLTCGGLFRVAWPLARRSLRGINRRQCLRTNALNVYWTIIRNTLRAFY